MVFYESAIESFIPNILSSYSLDTFSHLLNIYSHHNIFMMHNFVVA